MGARFIVKSFNLFPSKFPGLVTELTEGKKVCGWGKQQEVTTVTKEWIFS